ncbi:AAA family ATPase [Cytophagaceae bacterium YF14B1]|uniref:AAA family ATPase n=1 Tax=Xanthocytophaga flava TaxID=3048013 RepID=A0AAE3QRC7_9BACT|nr:AAA family ATPase [Xanthocytophaga flavus]MDJ1483501.1 AAA family ATPase [Xanthocytophaga flavus]
MDGLLDHPTSHQGSNLLQSELETSYELTLNYTPVNQQSGISLNGIELIRPGEILLLTAAPGTGKTNVMEVFPTLTISAVTSTEAMGTLNFSIPSANELSRCLIIDTERTKDDAHSSLKRIFKRLGQDSNVIQDGKLKGADFRCFIEIAKVEDRRKELERLLEAKQYTFLVIDGAIDFVIDANNLEQSIECVRWLRAIAAKYNLCLITTLHPNPGTTKPVGHLGTFLCRWSRAVLLIQKTTDGVRLITSDFDNGKLSHADQAAIQAFGWDESLSMFNAVTTSFSHLPSQKPSSTLIRDLINKIFVKRQTTQIAATELKKILINEHGKTEWQAKNALKTAVEFGYLTISGSTRNSVYVLTLEDSDSS